MGQAEVAQVGRQQQTAAQGFVQPDTVLAGVNNFDPASQNIAIGKNLVAQPQRQPIKFVLEGDRQAFAVNVVAGVAQAQVARSVAKAQAQAGLDFKHVVGNRELGEHVVSPGAK